MTHFFPYSGDDATDVSEGNTFLLQIHGRTELTTKAVQVPREAASLNTNDCFVLVSPQVKDNHETFY